MGNQKQTVWSTKVFLCSVGLTLLTQEGVIRIQPKNDVLHISSTGIHFHTPEQLYYCLYGDVTENSGSFEHSLPSLA